MSIKKNFLYNILLNISNIAFPIITIPYVSRILDVDQIGEFSFVTTLVEYFVLFAALGKTLFGSREIAKLKDNKRSCNRLFNRLFTINIISSIFVSFIFLLSLFGIQQLTEIRCLLFIAGIPLYFSALDINWFYSGLEKFKLISLRSVFVKLVLLIGLLCLVKNKSDLIIYVLLNSLTFLINYIINIYFFIKEGFSIRLDLSDCKVNLKGLVLFFFSSLAMQIYLMIDTVMLGFMSSFYELGIYSSAIKSVRILMPIMTSLGMVMLPRLSYCNNIGNVVEYRKMLDCAFDVINFCSWPLMAYFLCIADLFILFFFGQSFGEATLPLRICSVLFVVSNFSYFLGIQVMTTASFESRYLIATVCGVIFNLLFNVILIPSMGARGAAWASVIGEIMVSATCVYYVYKLKLYSISWRCLKKSCCASFIFPLVYVCMFLGSMEKNFLWFILYSFIAWVGYILIQCKLKNSVCMYIFSTITKYV